MVMSSEIVHEGWLTKSPPAKRIFRARWRRRWFVLRHSGELPGQYFLCYYTDRNCRKLKGQIDLDECEQVDTGLQFENNKQKYQHMFDVRTPKRIYYLAAESEEEMNKWVNCVCQVCGLKAYTAEDDLYNYGPAEEPSTPTTVTTETGTIEPESESPPVSPTSTTSASAYIPISECITGLPLGPPGSHSGLRDLELLTGPTATWRATSLIQRQQQQQQQHLQSLPTFYDSPRELRPPPSVLDLRANSSIQSSQGEWDAQKSPGTDGESVFTDEEWAGPGGASGIAVSAGGLRPVVNWETFPSSEGEQGLRPSDSSVDLDTSTDAATWNMTNRSARLTGAAPSTVAPPPPRPPKPSHLLLDPQGHNYLNIDSMSPALSHTPGSADTSEPPSPLITTSTPLDGPSAIPGSAVVSDEMYDFPRSHQYPEGATDVPNVPKPMSRHCYSNAAPGQVNGDVFRYDFDGSVGGSASNTTNQDDEPTSPRSESSSVTSATQYSNLPSPHVVPSSGVPTPPAVNRGLKPHRKNSAASNEPSPSPQPSIGPPSVDRKLKPARKYPEEHSGFLTLAAPPGRRNVENGSRSLRKTRTGPSPTPPQPPGSAPMTLRNGFRRSEQCSSSDDDHGHSPHDDEFYVQFYGSDHQFLSSGKEIKYLDLDLDKDKDGPVPSTSLVSVMSGMGLHPAPKSPEKGPPTATVYKTVDFLKTEAFNRTRQMMEEDRKKNI